MTLRRISILIVLAILVVHATATVCPAQRLKRGRRGIGYRQQWAIVIGINYVGRKDARSEGVTELENAEADAQSIATTLIEYYGYPEENVHVLIGKQATRSHIERLFGEKFLNNPDVVKEDDSVFVFYAGHGDARVANDHTRAVLWPFDVDVEDGQGVVGNTMKLLNIVDDLKSCVARHKLLILDSCHSGAVFKVGGLQRSGAQHRFDQELFSRPVFYAMSAARSFQKAADGDEHSPFTLALLECLHGGIDSEQFGASALETRVSEKVREFSQQDPDGGKIGGEGEFFFFRQKKADPQEFVKLVEQYKQQFATRTTELQTAAVDVAGTDASNMAAMATTVPSSSSNLPWIIMSSAFFFLLVGGGAVFVLSKRMSPVSVVQPPTVPDAAAPNQPLASIRAPRATQQTISEGTASRITLKPDSTNVSHVCLFGMQADLGRSDVCAFSLPFGSKTVSGQHARLRYLFKEKHYVIEDLDSRNGTYVVGDAVTDGQALETGVQIQLGQSVILDFKQIQTEVCDVAVLSRRKSSGEVVAAFVLAPMNRLDLTALFAANSESQPDSPVLCFDDEDGFYLVERDDPKAYRDLQSIESFQIDDVSISLLKPA